MFHWYIASGSLPIISKLRIEGPVKILKTHNITWNITSNCSKEADKNGSLYTLKEWDRVIVEAAVLGAAGYRQPEDERCSFCMNNLAS